MSTTTITDAGAHAAAAATDRIPALKTPFTPGTKGYLTPQLIATYAIGAGNTSLGSNWSTALGADYLGEKWAHWYGNLGTAQGFTDAVQAMIADMAYPYGGIGRIPPGNYTLNEDVFQTRGVTIRGPEKGICTINMSAGAQWFVGAQSTTTADAWLENILFVGQNGDTDPCVVFDRTSRCGARNLFFAGVDGRAIDIGTSANPSLANTVVLDGVSVLLDAANTSAVRVWGGGGHQLRYVEATGQNGNSQTCYDIFNTAAIDGIRIEGGGTGDCDYGFRWRGSANCINILATANVGFDRCARGSIHVEPTGTAGASDWTFEGIYAAGVGSTTGVDAPVVHVIIGAGRSFGRLTLSGLIKDGRQEGVRFEGAGTLSDINLSGLSIQDGARAAANTYSGICDATTSGISRLTVAGSNIRGTSSTLKYGIEVVTAGSGTLLKDVLANNISGAATADIYFGGAVMSAHLGNGGKQWTDIASATTTNLAGATGDYGDVTGTTTITGLGTCPAGIERTATFTGALLLTHNATSLILPTGANITTAAGDCARFVSLGSGNWKCLAYTRASGVPLTDALLVHLAGTETITGQKTADDLRLGGMGATNPTRLRGWSPGASGTLADDAAATVGTMTAGTVGQFRISAGAESATISFKTAGTPTLYSVGATSNVNVTTGSLAGTTGVDGKLTLSIDTNRVVYVENRLAATASIVIDFSGG